MCSYSIEGCFYEGGILCRYLRNSPVGWDGIALERLKGLMVQAFTRNANGVDTEE